MAHDKDLDDSGYWIGTGEFAGGPPVEHPKAVVEPKVAAPGPENSPPKNEVVPEPKAKPEPEHRVPRK